MADIQRRSSLENSCGWMTVSYIFSRVRKTLDAIDTSPWYKHAYGQICNTFFSTD
jgi:hypothetical protein